MRLLELFSGTGSIGKEFPGEVVSVDIVGNPTHKCCVYDFDFTVYGQGYFDVVWASPPAPCTPLPVPPLKAPETWKEQID